MLDVESSQGLMMLDVVVKLAFGKEQRAALRNEYEIYRLLRSKGVVRCIATVLGLFDDFEGGPSALVMLYAGGSLGPEPERPLSVDERWVISQKMRPSRKLILISKHSEAALTTLKSVHQVGILHGDIRHQNILVGNSGVTIIDFAYSRRCKSRLKKGEEYRQLRSLLKVV